MKLLHLSDLHLGKKLNEFSLYEDQKYILQRIVQMICAKQPDCVLLAGDIYDKPVPPAEAVVLFDDFLNQLAELKVPVCIISGNHDSAERLAFGAQLMSGSGIHFAGSYNGEEQKLVLEDEFGKVNVFLLPFLKRGEKWGWALAVLGLPLAVFLVIASQPGINQVLYAGGHNPLQVLHSHLAANTELLAALGIGGIYLLLPESRKT